MKITNLGHSSFLFETNNMSFVVDPYSDNSVPGLTFPSVSANKVFISHDHHDHNAINLVKLIPNLNGVDHEVYIVPHDHENGKLRGLNKIHIFYIDNLKIIHTGDLGCIPDKNILEKMMNADIIFAPINGFYTISAEELHEICNIIKPRLVVPMHYYKSQDNSGYPDGGQIDIFKKLFSNYLEVNENSVIFNDEFFKYDALIFNGVFQEEK